MNEALRNSEREAGKSRKENFTRITGGSRESHPNTGGEGYSFLLSWRNFFSLDLSLSHYVQLRFILEKKATLKVLFQVLAFKAFLTYAVTKNTK